MRSYYDDRVVALSARLVTPFIQLFALYVIFHGHYSPGGGFQGGVIFGAAIILYAISNDLRRAFRRLDERAALLASAVGVLIYSGTGLLCLLLGGNFLDYNVLASNVITGQHIGIVVIELGVGITVSSVMLLIFFTFTRRGKE